MFNECFKMQKKTSSSLGFDFSQFEYAHGKPKFKGLLKSTPEDFIVEEQIPYSLSGEGEHLWCWIEKRGENTDWVAEKLAKWANTSKVNVGYAGKKDRHAITRQWFSIQLPGLVDPCVETFELKNVKILKTIRHNKKLQKGALAGNHFKIALHHIQSANADEFDHSELQTYINQRMQRIGQMGVPNYFGEQRFGHQGGNLLEGQKLLSGDNLKVSRQRNRRKKGKSRNQQGLYISAIRSWMFNAFLSQRIQAGCWNKPIEGDVLLSSDANKLVVTEDDQAHLEALEQGEYFVSGALFGDGKLETHGKAFELENSVMQTYQAWCDGLASNRIQPSRRTTVLLPQQLTWKLLQTEQGVSLDMNFYLPAGSFATMVLREIIQVYEAKR